MHPAQARAQVVGDAGKVVMVVMMCMRDGWWRKRKRRRLVVKRVDSKYL
jgi:hypothetical protein